jgi:predicted nucleotidyltransferase
VLRHPDGVVDVPRHVREAIADLRRRLEERFGGRLEQVRLFGSYARGDPRPDSDVDLLVVIDGLTLAESEEVNRAHFDVEMERGVAFGGFACSSEEWRTLKARERLIAGDIDREGISF